MWVRQRDRNGAASANERLTVVRQDILAAVKGDSYTLLCPRSTPVCVHMLVLRYAAPGRSTRAQPLEVNLLRH